MTEGRRALKIFKVKNRARALRFLKAVPVLALLVDCMGETTISLWVKPRVYPQKIMGETTCLSTGMGETTIGVIPFQMGRSMVKNDL